MTQPQGTKFGISSNRNSAALNCICGELAGRFIAALLLCGMFVVFVQKSHSGVSDISVADARQSAIAFVTIAATPGLDGALMNVALEDRKSELWRSSLGFTADYTLRNTIADGYWGAAIVGGEVDETFWFDEDGQSVALNVSRKVVALRGSWGLSIPVNANLRVRPYLSAFVSDLATQSLLDGYLGTLPEQRGEHDWHVSSKVMSLTTTGSVEVDYSRWYGLYRLSALGQYHLSYTDTYSPNRPILDTWSWDQLVQVKTELSRRTGWQFDARDVYWQVFLNYTDFLDQPKTALGFTYHYHLGAGVEWELNVKPLNWFGFRSLGVKAGYLFGDDVSGYNLGFTAR